MTPYGYATIGAAIDLAHALFMVVYFVGMPLLFIHRWPRLSTWYARYAITFAVLLFGSRLFADHCFLTYLAGYFWDRSHWPEQSQEWLTVRLAMRIFRFAPTHQAVSFVGNAAVVVTAVGVAWLYRARRRAGGESGRAALR